MGLALESNTIVAHESCDLSVVISITKIYMKAV